MIKQSYGTVIISFFIFTDFLKHILSWKYDVITFLTPFHTMFLPEQHKFRIRIVKFITKCTENFVLTCERQKNILLVNTGITNFLEWRSIDTIKYNSRAHPVKCFVSYAVKQIFSAYNTFQKHTALKSMSLNKHKSGWF